MSASRATIINEFITAIITGNRGTTAVNFRQVLNDFVAAAPNINDDKNAANGYMGLDTNSRANVSLINAAAQQGFYLQDNGTWSMPPENLQEATINITGLTNLNLLGVTAHIINLSSSNSTENLQSISNFSGLARLYLRPANGLTVTFKDKSVLGGNLHLVASTRAANGTKQGFISLETRASEYYENIFIAAYT